MRRLTILGSTGTIGVNTLDVVARNEDRFSVFALTANRDVEAMVVQCERWLPAYAVMADEPSADRLRKRVASTAPGTEVLGGAEALEFVAAHPEADAVMAAIVGAAGLLPSLAAARAGKRILLANKEALVMSGRLFIDAVKASGAELLPIDSEHNAIFQCLPPATKAGGELEGVTRIILTGSGGPFRERDAGTLDSVTPDEACAHPNWVMGRKISVDSATMMNKGLEVIEACWLFDTPTSRVEVLVHPQSIIHSMVEFSDGSILAQLGNPDMRTPIAHALSWPTRIDSGVDPLDLILAGRLDFEGPDFTRFPCLRLGFEAAAAGGAAATVLNAANEIAVDAFLAGRLRFPGIARVVEETLEQDTAGVPANVDDVLEIDRAARRFARSQVEYQNA